MRFLLDTNILIPLEDSGIPLKESLPVFTFPRLLRKRRMRKIDQLMDMIDLTKKAHHKIREERGGKESVLHAYTDD